MGPVRLSPYTSMTKKNVLGLVILITEEITLHKQLMVRPNLAYVVNECTCKVGFATSTGLGKDIDHPKFKLLIMSQIHCSYD